MALTDVSVNVPALLHPGCAVRALNSRLLAALEFRVPFQVPRVYVTLGTPGTRVPLDLPKTTGRSSSYASASTSPRAERFLFLVIEILRLFHHHRAEILQVRFDLDVLQA